MNKKTKSILLSIAALIGATLMAFRMSGLIGTEEQQQQIWHMLE